VKSIKVLITAYREIISYLFFGACTTLVNVAVYHICRTFGMSAAAGTVTAWILSVLFAYVTNRHWVFVNRTDSFPGIFREGLSFVSCRLATGILDLAMMAFFVDLLHQNDMLIKILSNVLVIILNYLASKLFIFQKNE
jgi:putative flippase GtrA